MTEAERKSDATYILGHPGGEGQRLQLLSKLLSTVTKRLFEQAGITAGMKVLDVGSGTGEVALLLAELLGPGGSIVGVDTYPGGLEVARARLQAANVENVTFLVGDIRELVLDNDFDAVVGRNVLMYVGDQAEVLRVCASHLHSGGVLAFQETEWSILEWVTKMPSTPPLVQQLTSWTIDGFRKAQVEMQMAFKFPRFFLDAGLPLPQIILEGIMGSEEDNWVGYAFLVDTLRDILPKLYEYGILHEQLDSVTYIARLREEIRHHHTLLPLNFQVGAWTRKA